MSCLACPLHSSTSGLGSASIEECICDKDNGYFKNAEDQCIRCVKGEEKVGDACQDCPKGKSKASVGSEACTSCEAGKYQDSSGRV